MIGRRRWEARRAPDDAVRALARRAGLSETAARVLVLRGHTEPEAVERHLTASAHDLLDPFLLPGMDAAADRLVTALRTGETILVHGDYDVDGVTGTTLLVRMLREAGADVTWHIPNRLEHGYSFGDHSVEKARATGAAVVVSVDNGTSAFETIAALRDEGVDTVVTDHHEPPLPHPVHGALPPATAIVNPKLAGSEYPFPELCGGAVAFKLACGVAQRLSEGPRVSPAFKAVLDDALALVGLATVSDVVPLLGENRVFARWGLKALEVSASPGIAALRRVCGIDGRPLTSEDIGFQVGPRINAAGRLGSADRAVELLLCADAEEAENRARELDDLNARRKEMERELLEEALGAAREFADADRWPVLVLAGQGWHQGLVGIVAARLVDRFHRPALVVGLDGETGRGSARSVEGVSVLACMRGADGLFEGYGGHAQAAGCEVRADRVDAVRDAVCARARELLADAPLEVPPLAYDAEVPLDGMTEELMRELDRLGPWGAHNERPALLARDARLARPPRVCGGDGTHLMLQLRRGDRELKAMAFGRADLAPGLDVGSGVDVVYTPRWNTWRGRTNLEIEALDLRPSEGA